jgi:hypothetical protein
VVRKKLSPLPGLIARQYPIRGLSPPAILFAPFQGVTLLKYTDRRYQQIILLSDRLDGRAFSCLTAGGGGLP